MKTSAGEWEILAKLRLVLICMSSSRCLHTIAKGLVHFVEVHGEMLSTKVGNSSV